ncbi:hypothetical protein ElyMa_006027400 [Elysia marginata]|uniref:Uncharacterized protein n=1 Tax=Elysia marginata TaxID=1093978 RepID=A0AAV4GIP7_9GAST|nr:hypothetical protein ElyMa_006027400 [Elysia marginata]
MSDPQGGVLDPQLQVMTVDYSGKVKRNTSAREGVRNGEWLLRRRIAKDPCFGRRQPCCKQGCGSPAQSSSNEDANEDDDNDIGDDDGHRGGDDDDDYYYDDYDENDNGDDGDDNNDGGGDFSYVGFVGDFINDDNVFMMAAQLYDVLY